MRTHIVMGVLALLLLTPGEAEAKRTGSLQQRVNDIPTSLVRGGLIGAAIALGAHFSPFKKKQKKQEESNENLA